MHLLPGIILLYVGPEQLMPGASYIAAMAGVVLAFRTKAGAALRRIVHKFKKSAA